jgi:predicted TPR repeat methyltransferase
MPDESSPPGATEVSIDAALVAAIRLHRNEMFDEAEALYRRILDIAPTNPDALHFLGLLMRQRNRSSEALALMRQAVAAAPDFASAHNNLGNLLCEAGKLSEAAVHLLRALELEPDDPRALNNLGNIARAGGQVDAAIRYFERAVDLASDFALPYENLGRVYIRKGDVPRAHEYFCKAVALDAGLSHSKQFVGMALCELRRFDEARKFYEDWIASDPANPVPRHLLATVSPDALPTRASDAYVRTVFDSFASTFDVHLQRLEYRAPTLVADALQALGIPPGPALTVLDAGCGTGLCGQLLRPLAHRLEGVDLSPAMLEKARAGGNYDALAEGELTRHMLDHPASYDAITCADTLCYFGELTDVAQAAAAALRPGGCFVFTVEEAQPDAGQEPYRIHASGRYSHTEPYVRDVLARAGLQVASLSHAWLRTEIAKQVDGLVVAAVRPAA